MNPRAMAADSASCDNASEKAAPTAHRTIAPEEARRSQPGNGLYSGQPALSGENAAAASPGVPSVDNFFLSAESGAPVSAVVLSCASNGLILIDGAAAQSCYFKKTQHHCINWR